MSERNLGHNSSKHDVTFQELLRTKLYLNQFMLTEHTRELGSPAMVQQQLSAVFRSAKTFREACGFQTD